MAYVPVCCYSFSDRRRRRLHHDPHVQRDQQHHYRELVGSVHVRVQRHGEDGAVQSRQVFRRHPGPAGGRRGEEESDRCIAFAALLCSLVEPDGLLSTIESVKTKTKNGFDNKRVFCCWSDQFRSPSIPLCATVFLLGGAGGRRGENVSEAQRGAAFYFNPIGRPNDMLSTITDIEYFTFRT